MCCWGGGGVSLSYSYIVQEAGEFVIWKNIGP